MIARIKAAVARHEIDQMRRRLQRKMDQLAQAGRFHGGRRPYGYAADGMTVIDHEATIVQEYTARLLSGESFNEVIRDLNRREVKTTSGAPWTRASVKSMLTSPRVAGLRRHRGEVIAATASQLARCSQCSGPLHVLHRSGGRTPAYACRRGCGRVRVAVHLLDGFVERLLFARLAERKIGPLVGDDDRALSAQIAQAEAHQARLAVELGRNPTIRPEAKLAVLAEAGSHLDQLYARQARQRRQSALAGMDPASVPQLWRSDQLTLSRKRLIVRDALGAITVKPARRRGGHLLDPDRVDVPEPDAAGGVSA